MNNRIEIIEKLWSQHLNSQFPKESKTKIISEIDLLSLDSYTAGCVDYFITSYQKLDFRREGVLKECIRDLELVTKQIYGYEKKYFQRLLIIAQNIIEHQKEY